jgi:mannose-6-phosphate isomerase-like protein (cupin superfamily)
MGGASEDKTPHTEYLQTADQAKGASIVKLFIAPGSGPSAHYHTRMEESFYVLEGEYSFWVGEREIRGGPGTFAFIPVGQTHRFLNIGPTPGRLLCVCSPPGHERYFQELDAALQSGKGTVDRESLAKLREKYDTIQV